MATYGKITIPLKAQKLFSCDLISPVGTDSLVGSMSTYGRPVFESKLKDLFFVCFSFCVYQNLARCLYEQLPSISKDNIKIFDFKKIC